MAIRKSCFLSLPLISAVYENFNKIEKVSVGDLFLLGFEAWFFKSRANMNNVLDVFLGFSSISINTNLCLFLLLGRNI